MNQEVKGDFLGACSEFSVIIYVLLSKLCFVCVWKNITCGVRIELRLMVFRFYGFPLINAQEHIKTANQLQQSSLR